jgi:hypothetical protein
VLFFWAASFRSVARLPLFRGPKGFARSPPDEVAFLAALVLPPDPIVASGLARQVPSYHELALAWGAAPSEALPLGLKEALG